MCRSPTDHKWLPLHLHQGCLGKCHSIAIDYGVWVSLEVDIPHLAIPSETGKSLDCLETRGSQKYSNEQHIWFSALPRVHEVEVSTFVFMQLTCNKSPCSSFIQLYCICCIYTAFGHSLMPLQLVEDAERRIWVFVDRPPDPQPSPSSPCARRGRQCIVPGGDW